MGRLLGVTRWVGRDGGRRGGLGLSGVVCAGGTGGGRSGEELKEGEPKEDVGDSVGRGIGEAGAGV
jgi:hypothetical protein